MVLIVFAFVFGFVTIAIQENLAFAESSEKIQLVQKYEQFPGQVVTGFCNVKYDDQGNFHWEIKVSGLEPNTQGHFDMGHWSGDKDVKFTADEEGNAYSGKQVVINKNVLHSLFSEFSKCHVRTSIDSHLDNPGIAVGDSKLNIEEQTTQNSTENSPKKFPPGFAMGETMPVVEDSKEKKGVPFERKSFIFYSLEFVLGIFKGNFANIDENEKFIPAQNQIQINPKGLNKKPIKENPTNSFFGPPAPPTNKRPTIENNAITTTNPKNEFPSIKITTPEDNSFVNGKITIKASVNNFPEAVVIFYVDGLPIGTDFVAPYEMSHHTKDMKPGDHKIKVEISSSDYEDTIIVLKGGNTDTKKANPTQLSEEKKDTPNEKCNPGKQKKGLC